MFQNYETVYISRTVQKVLTFLHTVLMTKEAAKA